MSIYLLEFVVEIINYEAITFLFQNNPGLYKHPFPLLMNWTDNITSKSWIKKAASKTRKGKILKIIAYSLMMNYSVNLKVKHISGVNNVLVDSILSIYLQHNSVVSFDNLMQKFPQMKSWSRFHPSQELISTIYSELLVGQGPGCFIPKTLGHFSQDRSVSSNLLKTIN